MIKVTKIEFQMVEGPSGSKFMRKATFTTWEGVNAHISRARHSGDVPERGYNKCDFWLTFEDGETYEGRYDLSQDPQQDALTLDGHVREFNAFYAGQRRPAHMTERAYEEFMHRMKTDPFHVKDRTVERAAEFLANYQLGDDRAA